MVLHSKTTGSLVEKDIIPVIAKKAVEQEGISVASTPPSPARSQPTTNRTTLLPWQT